MDLPPVHHHRYVPTPPKFSDNPNFYHSQPHRLPPPPPLPLPSLPPPAPPPQHHLSLPPLPPLPSAVQTQVSFRPNPTIEERSPKFSNFIPSHLLNHSRPPPRPPSPPRVASYHHNSRNHPRFEDNSRFSDPWPDLPPLPRFPPEPPLHHHNHHRPISPLRPDTESCPTDFQRSLRFRNEFMDEGFRDSVNPQLPLWGRKEVHLDAHDDMDDHKYRYRARYECNSDRMDRDFVSGDSQGTGFSLNPSREFVGNYDLYNNREEDLRWGDSRLETDCAYGDNNGFSLHLRSERRELFESSDYDDVSRFNHNRVGEKRADEFFSRSPRKKQLQKKSALLRIQLGKVNNNNRNRSHDHNHFQKSYHDESNSIGGGSFKGKEKDVFVRLERKREEEREKSPVELDVSFKSNALVAKAKKATPSSVVDSNGNLMPRNRKIREMDLSDSPGIKLGENLNETVSYTNHPSTFDKDCQELAKNATTDKTDQPTRGSHHPARFDKRQKSAEKVSAVRTDSCIRGSDIPSDSDKDLGQLAKKIRVSAGGLQPCSSGLGGNSANKESPKSVESGQGDKGVASDGRKRKRVAIPLQSKRDSREPTKGKSSSADCPSQTIPLDEGASGSAGMGIVSAVASEFLTDDLADEIAKHSSQVASNFKKQDVDIKSSQLFLPQSSATASVLQYSGDVYVCEATDHAEISVRDGYSVLNFDKVVDHPFQDEPLLLESGPARKVMDLVEGNATEEDKVYDGQIDAYTSRNEGYSTSSSENRFCRRSAKVDVADSMNTICEESLPNQVRAAEVNDIVEGSSNPVTPVGSNAFLCFSEIDKTTVNQVATNEICSNTHTLGIRMISNTCLLDDTTKQSLDAATTVSENGSIERPQNFMVSDMDGFSNNYIKVHSPRSKGKRKATDDQLRIYDTKMSEIAAEKVSNGHYEDANLSFSEKNIVTVEEEVVPGDRDDILKKGCSGVYSEVNVSVAEGKAMFHSPISLAPVLSNAYQNPNGGDTSTPSTEVPPNTEEVKTRTEHGIALCTSDDMTSACSEPSVVLLREDTIATHSDQAVSLEDGSMARCSKMEPLTSSLSKLEDVPKGNTTLVISTVDLQPGSVDVASGGSRDNFVGSINQKASYGDDNCEINLPYTENLASLSHNLSLRADVNCVLSTNSADRLVDSDPEALLNNMTSPSEDVPSYLVLDMQNSKSRASQIPNGHSGKEKIFTKSPVSDVDTARPSSLSSRTDAKFGQELIHPVNSKSVLPLSQNNSKVIPNSNSLNSLPEKSSLSYNRLTASIHWGFSGRTSVKYPSTGKAPAFKNASRPRTWHRTGTSSHSVVKNVSLQTNSQKELGKVPSSYIRKGNSLVRKPSPVGSVPQGLHANTPAIYRLSPGIDNLKRARGSENSINLIGPSTSTTMEGLIAGPERPKTPPLTGIVKSLNCTPVDQGDSTCSPLADPFANDCPGETFDLSKSTENMDVKMCSVDGLKPSAIKECEAGSRSNLDGRSTIDERNSGKKITYVKRKANQLVAASNASDPSFQGSEKPQALSSDGYYKRRKNQLIRTSEDSVKQRAVIPDKCLSSHRQESQKNTRNRSSSKKQSGFAKKKFSLVWTLHGTLSSKKDGNSGHFHRVRPFLFPWKRATYWTNFMHCLSSMPNDNLASAISSRKLVLSRKSDMIYKKSISGFSLRRSKVLSFCGRSLKWTKSMERNSRKVNEDATLAAVAVEKRKREQNGAAFTRFNSRIYVPRERIFRIGSERYRMDPSGKTLQRISGEKPSYSEDQSENNAKKSFVPRRLLIGNDEYVRIGNGNQLIRDPKKRTRVLANEKVRWSLHTARLRLARKKKYCQFFTRFGKCKDDKKCPYIHDPSKIAVCTKFLNGSCSNPNCKLTHEVIPERMQDCSYFLQGLCSNESCPYRHVNVNPNSPICEGFLRGYCADGNECRKKHTYLCPEFEATGNCQQDAKCKLHHPKNKKKGIKSKASNVQKNARGRYFGARPLDVANSRTTVPKITVGECDDHIFCQDGKFTDFISLAGSEEAMEEVVEPTVELSCDSDREEPSDIQDLDELIKPIRIMNKNLVLDSSPAIDNSGEMTASYVSESSFADEVAILDAPYSASAE